MESTKFYWQKMINSENGPSSSTTRHVLLSLSIFMDESGGQCFPSNRTVAAATGLSRKCVRTHIEMAAGHGWLKVIPKTGTGQGWKRNTYQAVLPEKVGKEIPHVKDQRGVRATPPQGERGEPGSRTWETSFPKVGNQVPLNNTINSHIPVSNNARTFLLKDGSTFKIDDDFFQVLKDSYPKVDIESEFKKLSAWCHANPSKRKTRKGAKRFVNTWMSNAKPLKTHQSVQEFCFETQFHTEE
jgi:hypothetical protein